MSSQACIKLLHHPVLHLFAVSGQHVQAQAASRSSAFCTYRLYKIWYRWSCVTDSPVSSPVLGLRNGIAEDGENVAAIDPVTCSILIAPTSATFASVKRIDGVPVAGFAMLTLVQRVHVAPGALVSCRFADIWSPYG